jgi:signal transduction histidine kinase
MGGVTPFQVEFRVPLPNGNIRWLAVRAEPSAATSRDRRLLGLVQDITERKATEEALRKADRRKDEFLAMLSHELRNPLTPIRYAAEILRLIESDDPRLSRAVRLIDGQTAHMERLIEDLFDVARIAQGRLELRRETVALADVLTQALELSRFRIEERGQRLEVGLCPPSIRLSCDPVRLCQVFANLLDNAAKYTEEGGEIRLRVRIEDNKAQILIRDSGRGIAPEELPHLFDGPARERPRPAPPLSGLGLGLSIVKRLVDMHGGDVTAESPGIGDGACFSVRLPLLAEPGAARAATASASKLRILVVDDDRDIAESTGLLLQSLGHTVDLASDGEQAVRQARERRYRLVLLDIGLGDSDGTEVARRLRQLPHGRDMRIAAVTGYGDARTRREARAAGIDRHLLKPLSLSALQELVDSLPS